VVVKERERMPCRQPKDKKMSYKETQWVKRERDIVEDERV